MPRLRQPPKESAPPASVRFQKEEEPEKQEQEGFEQEEPEPEVKAEERKAEQDAAAELKKQIEALKRAEQEQRERADKAERERQQALEEARARAEEVRKTQGEVVQSRADLLAKAIEKETDAAEAAERDLAIAMAEGDAAAAAKAQRRLSQAEAKLVTLQNGKDAIEAEIAEAKAKPESKAETKPRQQTVEEAIDGFNLPDTAKRWLKAHPDYMTDPRKNAKIQSLHWDVLDEGLPAFSDAYYASLEAKLGMRKVETEEPDDDDGSPVPVSAPVSREVPSSNGRRSNGVIKLTAAQREAAKMAGITETEYAKQMMKLQAEKDSGNYGERR